MSTRRTVSAAVASTTTLALAVGAGVLIGRAGGGTAPPPGGSDPGTHLGGGTPAVVDAALRPASSCEDLLAHYVARGVDQVGPYGWDSGPIVMFDAAGSPARTTASAPGTAATTVRSTSGESGTNVQETGVDEPDVVKVDGDRLYRIRGGVFTAYDVSGDEPVPTSTLTLTGLSDGELLVSGDRVVVLGRGGPARAWTPTTRVVVLDVTDPGVPRTVSTTDYDAELTAARLHGDVVRLVLRTYRPELDFVTPTGRRGQQEALRRNQDLVRATTLADWLPTVDGEPVVACDQVALPDDDAALGTTTVVGFRPAAGEPVASAVAAETATSYFSAERLYLVAEPSFGMGWWGGLSIDCPDRCLPPGPGPGRDDGTSQLYAFALDGTATAYVAAGEVEGSVRDRWAMDFAGDTLRVAVGPTSETGDFNSVVTLREEGGALVEAGRVDDLGPGEQIKSVRWFDDLAIVVTFRQTDPLYAVDLGDPASPALLGELKIPGFSEYLHPLGERRLIGIGQAASRDGTSTGAQAALFDVTDLTAPRRLDVVSYPRGSQAGAGLDPRQFTWLPERRTALTVVSQGWPGRTGWVSVLRLGGGRVENRMVEVEHGADVDQVRLVPLADGRVVLVTGEDVAIFRV